MAKDFAKRFYKSVAWEKCRKAYIAERINIDGGLCEQCRQQLGYIVHHRGNITEENISNPNITLNKNNLQYVCKNCHDKFEGHWTGHRKKELLVVFDENGQPISRKESQDI